MEITESMVYWITRLDPLKGCIVGIFIVGVLVTPLFVIWLSGMLSKNGEEFQSIKKSLRKYLPIWIVSFVLSLFWPFIPTTKEMCAIKIIPLVAKNEDMKEIPSEITKLAREWIEELRPSKK